jgi:quercetin dioxygenase-like cupin family protein
MRAALVAALVGCAVRPSPVTPPSPARSQPVGPEPAPAATEPNEEEKLAAIQKAMNELAPASQQCWAAAATDRFDIEGELLAMIEIGGGASQVTIMSDTTRSDALVRCMTGLLSGWKWAPPLVGQTIQLPFRFRAPAGQSVIDRRLVAWHGQGKLSLAVLLDESNTGNSAASMIELALASGGTTGMRWADRRELWYFLGAGEVRSVAGGTRPVAAGDMMYAPKGSAREVAAPAGDLHAVVVFVPGGIEGTERAGALPNREATGWHAAPASPTLLPAASAHGYGPATLFYEGKEIAASVLALPAGAKVPEHVHGKETEMLYVLTGAGTMTVAGTDIAVTPTSAIQIPPDTRHAFTATEAVRAVQIYTPGGPEQRFKKP